VHNSIAKQPGQVVPHQSRLLPWPLLLLSLWLLQLRPPLPPRLLPPRLLPLRGNERGRVKRRCSSIAGLLPASPPRSGCFPAAATAASATAPPRRESTEGRIKTTLLIIMSSDVDRCAAPVT
jgi:hypothetical protein